MKTPKQIIIETSRECQLRCIGCPINSDQRTGPGTFMDMGFFKSIIDRVNFPTVVIPWMNGEPLLHPRYLDMVTYITEAEIPMYITTNGMIWHEPLFEYLTDTPTSCYQIIFSLDGLPGSKSISAARPGSKPYLVVENIKRFIALKEWKGASIDLAVKIVQRGQDWEEVEDYILYWLDQGVDYVCEGRMLELETVQPMRRYPCQYYDNNFMVIRHDGELVLCAYNDHVVNEGANSLFTLDYTRPLLEVYNDERYERYRKNQRLGIYDGPCSNCGFAYTGSGFDGAVRFRRRPDKEVFYRGDYYNRFYSFRDKSKAHDYYSNGASIDESYYLQPVAAK